MTLFTVALAVATVTLVTDAVGHVAPSVDDNNRYLKVTPMRGGARFAYTVFFGEIPGAAERKLLDGNHDGRIDPDEAKRFGDKLAAEVAAALQLEIGSTGRPVTWKLVDVGLGSTAVAAGAFSVDMIAYLCAPGGRLRLRDQFRIPRPGETEVLVEDTPGVTVKTARVGPSDDPRHDYRFLGPGGPLSDDGLTVEWTATPTAPALPADCSAAPKDGSGGPSRPLPFVVGAVIVACAGVAGVLVAWRARRRTAS